MQPIPVSLAPFFQEYDLAQLNPQRDANTIIERTLQFGNRAEIHWLFTQYSRARIADWFRKYAQERLPDPHRTFWRIILEVEDDNLVEGVRVGFYGYGFPLVAPLVEAETIRMASIEDIALMKLDALLSRAARKDFYDLYLICQGIPLRTLLDLAPRKYAGIRDFEAQVVKRLVYFEKADTDAELQPLQPISWAEVKTFFIQQAREIGSGWL